MSRASEHHEHMTATFDRESAKASVVRILSKLIPSQLSISDCARISGANRSNISRALKGESLLNANDLSKIIKFAYKLKSTHELGTVLKEDDNELLRYFVSELGEEITNPEYTDSKTTINLNTAINSENAQLLYTVLYAKKQLKLSTVYELFGVREGNKLKDLFISCDIVVFHEKFQTIVLNEDQFSTDLEFRKKQINIICDSLNSNEVKKRKHRYQYDNLLVSKKYSDKLSSLLYSFRSDMNDLILEAEAEDSNERNIAFNYAVISTEQELLIKKEVKQ